MTIAPDEIIDADDFIDESAGASDAGKGVKTDAEGQIDRSFIKASFGGTGSDGALTISSGTTNIDLGGAQVVVKNYTSISITGTGALTFSNPHANGTIISLKCKGDVTITSSASPAISLNNLGCTVGGTPSSNTILRIQNGEGKLGMGSGVDYTNNGGVAPFFAHASLNVPQKNIFLAVGGAGGNGSGNVFPSRPSSGAGGGSLYSSGQSVDSHGGSPSGGSGGAGGRGAGSLYIECNGDLNITSTINAVGSNGGNGSGGAGQGGGGGGAGGSIVIYYNVLTANTATFNVNGGAGGSPSGSGNNGGTGANGYTLVVKNTEFV
jgi:hypothetical protein